jgi:hypothetical protein
MKYSLHHLLALVLLFAVALQAGRAYSLRHYVNWLEMQIAFEHAWRRLDMVEVREDPGRKKQQLCRQVVFDYEYPADNEAVARRYARLNSGEPQGQ